MNQIQEILIQPHISAKLLSVIMKVEIIFILLTFLIGAVQTEAVVSEPHENNPFLKSVPPHHDYVPTTEPYLYAKYNNVPSAQDHSILKRYEHSRIQLKPSSTKLICNGPKSDKKYLYYVSEEEIYFNIYEDEALRTVKEQLYRRCIKKEQICMIMLSTNKNECTQETQRYYDDYVSCLNGTKDKIGTSKSESANSIIENAEKVASSKVLKGDDIMAVSGMLKQVALRTSQNTSNIFMRVTPVSNREIQNTSYKLLSGVVKVCSNLLNEANEDSWKSLSGTDQKQAATSMLVAVEQTAFNMAGNINQENIIEVNGKNILLSVRVLNSSRLIDQEFLPVSSKQQWTTNGNSIHLPKEALIKYIENGLVRIVFMIFDRLSDVMQPQVTHEPQHETMLSTQELDTDNDSKSAVERIINSNVISACINDVKRNHLLKPVTFTLQHLRTNLTNPRCVYWNESLSVWSSEGCTLKWTNYTHTGCECIHLTNFAVLMDVNSVPLSSTDSLALHLITVIGCTISVLALFAATIIFHCFKGMKSDRILIHKNLCVCLSIAEIIFLFGIEKTSNAVLCGFIAAFLQYFFLAAFFWMFFEGFQLYAMLIEVFEPEYDRTRWYYPVAYVTPLIIIGISAIVDHTSYGTSQLCWLRSDNYFILSFMVPVAIILLANWSSLFMVVYIMCHHSDAMKATENSHRIRIWLRSSIFLAILLGLTWTFGLLYLNEQTIFMAYAFSIFNSLQGLFIFIFHCLLNETFQKECRRLGRQHSWLAFCLSLTTESTSLTMTGSSTAQHSKLSAKSSMSLNYGSSFNINDKSRKFSSTSRTHEIIFAERFILDHKPPPTLSKDDMKITKDTIARSQSINVKKVNERPLLTQENNITVLNFNRIPEETVGAENKVSIYDIPKELQLSKQDEIISKHKEDTSIKHLGKLGENEEFETENDYAVYEAEIHLEPDRKEIIQAENEYEGYNKEFIQMHPEKEEFETENEYAIYKTENHLVSESKEVSQMENEYDVYNNEFIEPILEKVDVIENQYAVVNTEIKEQIPKKVVTFKTENEDCPIKRINSIELQKETVENEYAVYKTEKCPTVEKECEAENEYAVYKTDNQPEKEESDQIENDYYATYNNDF